MENMFFELKTVRKMFKDILPRFMFVPVILIERSFCLSVLINGGHRLTKLYTVISIHIIMEIDIYVPCTYMPLYILARLTQRVIKQE